MLRALRRALPGSETTVHSECRRCGETLPRDATECPTCGSDEVASYRL